MSLAVMRILEPEILHTDPRKKNPISIFCLPKSTKKNFYWVYLCLYLKIINIKRNLKSPNWKYILNFCHGMFLHSYCLCPGSGSGFVSPQSPYGSGSYFYYCLQIRVHKSESASLVFCYLGWGKMYYIKYK